MRLFFLPRTLGPKDLNLEMVEVTRGSNSAGSRGELTVKHTRKEQRAANKVGRHRGSQGEHFSEEGLINKANSLGLKRVRAQERFTLGH